MHPVFRTGPLPNQPQPSALGVIPARYASSRFPGKVLADIDGTPMIAHVYRRAAACRSIARLVVATDDERIKRAVDAFGGVAVMTRADHPSGTDRVAEIAAEMDYDVVVNIQGDEPLVEPAMIEEALEPFASDPELMMSTLRRRIDDPAELTDPNVTKVVVDRAGNALYFSRGALPSTRAPLGSAVVAYKHIGLYVYRREFLLRLSRLEPTPLERAERLEQLRVLEHGFNIRVIETQYDSIGVDTPEDLDRVRRIVVGSSSSRPLQNNPV